MQARYGRGDDNIAGGELPHQWAKLRPVGGLETANSLYKWCWCGSIFGVVIAALAVASLMWGTRVRDRDFETGVTDLNGLTLGTIHP
jgi:hypothetical protein